MILLITTSFNITIQSIVQFLINEDIPFLRFNIDDAISDGEIKIEIHNSNVIIQGYPLEIFDKVICWKSNIDVLSSLYKRAYPLITDSEVAYKSAEFRSTLKFLINRIEHKIVFGYTVDDIDKLSQNDIARKVGLDVPETIISNNIETFNSIEREAYIVKPILKTYVSKFDKSFVERMTNINLETLNLKTSFPFISQKVVTYDYEVRVFYADEEFYSAKLIKPQHELDYRLNQTYHFEAYSISNDLKAKLSEFIEHFKLKTASFDLLIKNEQVWFLESNPTGNFIALMKECEYDLHAVFSKLFNNPLSIAI